MPSYSIGQAADLLCVSPETVRRWADAGRLSALRTPEGTRVVDGAALAAFARERATGLHPLPETAAATSVRNAFAGIVTAVRVDEVTAQVDTRAPSSTPAAARTAAATSSPSAAATATTPSCPGRSWTTTSAAARSCWPPASTARTSTDRAASWWSPPTGAGTATSAPSPTSGSAP